MTPPRWRRPLFAADALPKRVQSTSVSWVPGEAEGEGCPARGGIHRPRRRCRCRCHQRCRHDREGDHHRRRHRHRAEGHHHRRRHHR
ncbi:MAG TPA: hypothetical protein VIW01_09095, partial [Dehalococcoidia bacterium]